MGLTNGNYILSGEGENRKFSFHLDAASTEYTASVLTRVGLRCNLTSQLDRGYDVYVQTAVDNWDYYKCTAEISCAVEPAVSVKQNQQITKINAALNPFKQTVVPQIIKGEGCDIWDDASWEKFCKDINKYRANQVTDIYQSVLDALN